MNSHRLSTNQKISSPVLLRSINWILKSGHRLGFKTTLSKDKLIKNAKQKTGLNDLGIDFWDEPLDRLVSSINKEANLNPVGKLITENRLQNLLATRLRAEYWFKKNPAILEQKLYPVILIAGLQRTGTTKLHRLLGADPNNRTLASWEALNPAPMLNHTSSRQDPRIKFAKTAENALRIMAPSFFAIHPVEHLAEEEDILLLDTTFMSTTAEATMHVPSYSSWLEQTDQSPAYAYGVKLLKLLQWQRPGNRWILKSPHHLEFLDLASQYYGDVTFVWTHREISQCVPSFLNMLSHGYSIFSDHVSRESITNHWMNKIKYMLTKAISFRQTNGSTAEFIDIFYESLLDDPMKQLQRIYRSIHDIDSHLMETFIHNNRHNYRGKYGVHHYDAADFDLDKATLDQYFDYYRVFLNNVKDDKHLKL